MTLAATSFIDALKTAADQAEAAEAQFRREAAQRVAALERERAFAFRRLNLMRAIANAIAESENEEIAVASASAVLRNKLGWSTDSEARVQVLSNFASVSQAVYRNFAPAEDAPSISVETALAEFESWYAGGHSAPFWVLFEHYVPETPLVDF
jgi:hypothetical protein